MLDRAPARGDGGRQDDEYENEPEARQHTRNTGCRNPAHPHDYDADRGCDVGGTAAEMARFGRGSFRDLAGRNGPAPNRFQCYGEDTKAEGVADELESFEREAECAALLDNHPYERK